MTKILLLDNQERPLAAITQNLRNAGIEVLESSCVASALETARSKNVDLLLATEQASGLDVIDLLEIRKSENSLHDLAIIIASRSGALKLECFRLGCDDFINLPADEAEIFFRICGLLRRSGGKGVRGNFGDIGILDLVQMLVAARRDGVLSVEAAGKSGALYFHEGHVVHASLGTVEGEDAFLALLRASQKNGTFIFLSESTAQMKKTIDKRTDHLLLGFANQLDEE